MSIRYRILCNSFLRQYSQVGRTGAGSSATVSTDKTNVNVPGLSEAVVERPKEAVGPNVDPNKTGPYKVPEYFCYNVMSYYEAEIEMGKFRMPQPDAKMK